MFSLLFQLYKEVECHQRNQLVSLCQGSSLLRMVTLPPASTAIPTSPHIYLSYLEQNLTPPQDTASAFNPQMSWE